MLVLKDKRNLGNFSDVMLSRNIHNMTLKKPALYIHLSHKELSQSFLSMPSSHNLGLGLNIAPLKNWFVSQGLSNLYTDYIDNISS